jgi:hypothetical protein
MERRCRSNEVFIGRGRSWCSSNGCHFNCHASTQARHFRIHTKCADYLEGQAIISASEIEYKRHDVHAAMDTCTLDSSMFTEHIINPIQHWTRIA